MARRQPAWLLPEQLSPEARRPESLAPSPRTPAPFPSMPTMPCRTVIAIRRPPPLQAWRQPPRAPSPALPSAVTRQRRRIPLPEQPSLRRQINPAYAGVANPAVQAPPAGVVGAVRRARLGVGRAASTRPGSTGSTAAAAELSAGGVRRLLPRHAQVGQQMGAGQHGLRRHPPRPHLPVRRRSSSGSSSCAEPRCVQPGVRGLRSGAAARQAAIGRRARGSSASATAVRSTCSRAPKRWTSSKPARRPTPRACGKRWRASTRATPQARSCDSRLYRGCRASRLIADVSQLDVLRG